MARPPAIGIDLGTTHSAVGVVRHGNVEILANEFGHSTTPSYVAFTDVERLFGKAAKDQAALNAKNTIFDVKRLIGRKYSDLYVQQDTKSWPFKIKKVNEMPKVEVEFKGETKEFFAEEISAMVLSKMKEIAENYLNQTVKDAVITVPAYFNDAQRQATRDAGVIAGLNVLSIINEPTAAAIAFGFQNSHVKSSEKKNVLVYDLGGGTFDVSIVTIENFSYKVKATCGDTHLGGEDFDSRLVEHFAEEFKTKYGKDIQDNACAMRRLRSACERAKRTLSSATQASVDIDALCDGINFSTKITRLRFESINGDLFAATLKPVEQALKDACLQKSDVNEIILVGGSTRIPKIQKLLYEFFEEKKQLNKWINPDEAVAYGAAVQAAILHGDYSMSVFGLVLEDVTALSLGIAHGDHFKVMGTIIKRNSTIPMKRTAQFCTFHDYQTEMKFLVYQGESRCASDNHLLGEFELKGIRFAKAGKACADVSFEIDSNGILRVKAVDEANHNNTSGISIENVSIHFSKEQIKQMIEDEQKYVEGDRRMKENQTIKMDFEDQCYQILHALCDETKNTDGLITNPGKAILKYECEESIEWMKANPNAETAEYNRRLEKVKSLHLKFMDH